MKEKLFTVTMDDVEIQTFRAGGKGGQHQNKTDSGVRLIHHPSGARGESREERSQLQNKKAALKRLADDPKFKYWVAIQTGRFKTDEQWLAEQMNPQNIKEEVRVNGKWVASAREIEGDKNRNLS